MKAFYQILPEPILSGEEPVLKKLMTINQEALLGLKKMSGSIEVNSLPSLSNEAFTRLEESIKELRF